MGLFGNSQRKNAKMFRDVMREENIRPRSKTVSCPKCGRRYTATFLGPNDSVTCKQCNYKIYAG